MRGTRERGRHERGGGRASDTSRRRRRRRREGMGEGGREGGRTERLTRAHPWSSGPVQDKGEGEGREGGRDM